MPTRRGIASMISGIAILFVARIAAIHELYVLGVAAISFPAVAVAFVRLGRARLTFQRTMSPARVFAGGTVRVTLRVQNAARVSSPPLQLDEQGPPALGGARRTSIPSLRTHADESFVTERPAVSRGRRTLPPLRARLVDPFGFAQTARSVTGPASITIYPRVEMLHERAPREARGGTGRSSMHRIAAGGDDFYAVREYEIGDDLRRIHWRSSARRDNLMIRQDEVRPFPRATIVIDTRLLAHPGNSASLEWGISAAASLVWELASQGFALRIATTDSGPGGARWGREAVDPLLTTLALVPASNAASLAPSLKRCARMPGAGGALVAILPPPARDQIPMLARAGRAYAWRGAVLLDVASFAGAPARERAAADQRIAESERALLRAGWRVDVAGASDRFPQIWQKLLDATAHQPSSQLPHS